MNIDQRDLGTIEGFDVTAHLEPDTDSTPMDADCYTEEQISAWRNGDWSYVGTVITASRADVELGHASLWGSEYGSLPGVERFVNPLQGDGDAFVNGYGPGLIAEAVAEARVTLNRLLREQLSGVQRAADAMQRFIDANADPEGDEPKCGYRHWDEKLADYREEISYQAELLLTEEGE